MNKKIISTSYSMMSEDGVSIRIEETIDGKSVVLSLVREGRVETASLNKDQFEAFFDLKYKFNLIKSEEKEEENDGTSD